MYMFVYLLYIATVWCSLVVSCFPGQDPPGTRPIGGGYGGRLPQMNRDGEQVRDMAEFEEDRDSENAIMLESGLS